MTFVETCKSIKSLIRENFTTHQELEKITTERQPGTVN